MSDPGDGVRPKYLAFGGIDDSYTEAPCGRVGVFVFSATWMEFVVALVANIAAHRCGFCVRCRSHDVSDNVSGVYSPLCRQERTPEDFIASSRCSFRLYVRDGTGRGVRSCQVLDVE